MKSKKTLADQRSESVAVVRFIELFGTGGRNSNTPGVIRNKSGSLLTRSCPWMTRAFSRGAVWRRCLTLCPLSAASENCHDFHPMFFTHDRSFEEFFCICIQLLNKTWKEMRATSEDFNKVPAESAPTFRRGSQGNAGVFQLQRLSFFQSSLAFGC